MSTDNANKKRGPGRPKLDNPMVTVGVRLDPHDVAALRAYGVVKGHNRLSGGARALILEGLERLRRSSKRLQGELADNRSYFTDAKA